MLAAPKERDKMDLTTLSAVDEKDIAASLVPEYAQPWDREVERRVVRKIDLALLPLMWVGYGLVYYDKVSCPPGLTRIDDRC